MVIWGATPAATKYAVSEIDAVTAGVLRTVIAAAFTLPAAFIGRMRLPRDRGQWGLLALSAAGGFLGFTLLFSLGVQMTSTAHAALINASIPVFAGTFGALAERRAPGFRWSLGVLVSLTGIAALIGFRNGGGGEATIAGDLVCVASSICAGIGYVAGGRLSVRMGSLSTTFWSIGLAGLAQAVLVWVLWGATDWSQVTLAGWGGILYLALGSSILGYLFWYWALAVGGVVRMAPVQFVMPVVSLTLAVVLFGETLTLPILLSAAAIVGGIAVARRR